MNGIDKIIELINNDYDIFISESEFEFSNIKLPHKKSFQDVNKNGKNLVFVFLQHKEKIIPHITLSNDYTIVDHKLPYAQSFNYNCVTVFFHFNIDNVHEELFKLEKLLNNS